MSQSRGIVWPVLAIMTLLVIGGCGLLAFTTCNPPDRVEVIIKVIPSKTNFLGIAAVNNNEPESMLWSLDYLGMPFEMHPADLRIGEYGRFPSPLHVRWRSGEKYGVVMQTQKGE